MPFLRRDRHRIVAFRQQLRWDERDLHRRWIPDCFREEADHVVEIDSRSETAVPPGGVTRAAAHRCPGLSFGDEPRMHRCSHQVELHRDQRIEVVVEGVAERRSEDDGPDWSGLVVIVHDLRVPRAEENAVHRLRFRQRCHVRIAIVIVTGVLVIEARQSRRRALQSVGVAHIPVGHQLLPVGIGRDQEDDVVAEEAQRLWVGSAHQLICRLD